MRDFQSSYSIYIMAKHSLQGISDKAAPTEVNPKKMIINDSPLKT